MMRNPWGKENYHSDYSDYSELWTSHAMQNRAGNVMDREDGEFFMPIDIYKKYVLYTVINFNMDNVTTDHHLTLNSTPNNGTGIKYCRGCTYEKFEVTTEEDQTVNMKVATWERRGIP